MKKKIKVLHIDDSSLDRQLVIDALRNEHDQFEVYSSSTKSTFEKLLKERDYDIVLSDFNILGFDGLSVLKIVKDNKPETPVIIVTGTGTEEIAIEAMKMGASDYVIKTVSHIRGLSITIFKVLEKERLSNERKRAITALKQSEEKYRKIFENFQDVYYQTDINGILTDISPSVYRHSGYTPEDLIGTESADHYYLKSTREALMKILRRDMEVWNFHALLKAKSGKPVDISVNAHFRFDEDMKVIGVEGSMRNITDSKRMEKELRRAKEKAEESDRLKSAFLANMSHEIRTPMNGVLGFNELLRDNTLTENERLEHIDIIEKCGERLVNIIDDLIDISKIESGQMTVSKSKTDIEEVLAYITNLFKQEVDKEGIKLLVHKKLSEQAQNVYLDREKLYAILTNIVKNAIKYSNVGTINLMVESRESNLLFSIKDSGIGIPKDRHEEIFKRFVQADVEDKMAYQGAGLGLSITKAYVEMLGGEIWLESEPGKGTIFFFTIPIEDEPAEDKILQKESNVLDSNQSVGETKKSTILIAEDDENTAKYLSVVVRKYCDVFFIATNGLEAVDYCLNNSEVDLILMDIKMPKLNGYEAIKRIREFNKEVIIIAQTAYGQVGDKEKAIEAGCNDYISKPVMRNDLIKIIEKHLGVYS